MTERGGLARVRAVQRKQRKSRSSVKAGGGCAAVQRVNRRAQVSRRRQRGRVRDVPSAVAPSGRGMPVNQARRMREGTRRVKARWTRSVAEQTGRGRHGAAPAGALVRLPGTVSAAAALAEANNGRRGAARRARACSRSDAWKGRSWLGHTGLEGAGGGAPARGRGHWAVAACRALGASACPRWRRR